MIEFDLFMPLIKTRAQGVPEPIAVAAIRQAAIEFCSRTKIWRGTDRFYATNIDAIALPSGSALVEVANARFNGLSLESISMDELNRLFPTTDWMTSTADAPRYFTQIDMDTIKVVPMCEGYVDLTLILKPSYSAKQLPDLLSEYRQVIADGALGEIFTIPNQTYTSPDLAMYHISRFNEQLDRLSLLAIKGQIRANARTKTSFF